MFKIPGNSNLINYINSVIGFSIYKNTIDNFPLIKWIPSVIIGIFIGRLIYYYQTKTQTKKALNNKQNKQNKKIKNDTNTSHNTFLSFLGKNTLMLYAIHIPIIIICIKLYMNYIK